MAKDKERDEPAVSNLAVPRDIVTQLKTIASEHNINLPEALAKFGGPSIYKEFRRISDKMQPAVVGGEG